MAFLCVLRRRNTQHEGTSKSAYGDYAEKSIKDGLSVVGTICNGDVNAAQVTSGKSPYGVWDGMSTPQGGETTTL